MSFTASVLIASTDFENRRAVASILKSEGWNTMTVAKVSDCLDALSREPFDLIFCDCRLTDGNYNDLLKIVKLRHFDADVVVMSRLADWEEYLEVLRRGAFDLVVSPCQPTDILWTVSQVRRERQRRATLDMAPPAVETPANSSGLA